MFKKQYLLFIVLSIALFGCGQVVNESSSSGGSSATGTRSMIIDHACTNISLITDAMIAQVTANLHIAYWHTSHGSQLVDGMTGLVGFKGNKFAYNNGGASGALDLYDNGGMDLGNPDRTTWETTTRTYLNANPSVNVVMWSWCGQVSTSTTSDIEIDYLSRMSGLEHDYPNVKFVYMTGHLDAASPGLTGNLHIRNEQIRTYCRTNNKILYDFEDIESYDPDGTCFGNKIPDDGCNYDTDNDGVREGNWATEWQTAHTLGTDWYNCSSAHSEPLNANRKAYAAWWLLARIAGWSGN